MIFSSGSVQLRPYFVAPGPRVDQQRLVRRSRLRWPQVRVEVANLFRKDELPCEDPPMGRPSRLWYLSPFGNLSPKKYLFHLGATETLGTGKKGAQYELLVPIALVPSFSHTLCYTSTCFRTFVNKLRTLVPALY